MINFIPSDRCNAQETADSLFNIGFANTSTKFISLSSCVFIYGIETQTKRLSNKVFFMMQSQVFNGIKEMSRNFRSWPLSG